MAKTVIGLFRSMSEAESVVRDLEAQGCSRSDISIMASEGRTGEERAGDQSDVASGAAKGAGTGAAVGGGLGLIAGLASLAIPGFGPVIAAGPIVSALTGGAIGAAAGGIIGGLTSMGVSDEDAQYYAEGVRRGGVLVAVKAEENQAEQIADIMESHNAEDVEKRSEEWRTAGWAGPSVQQTSASGQRTTERATERTGERSIPIVEEQMQVGKREVQRGGVRVYSHLTEQPVEERINLREERVNVQRRPADRPATEQDMRAFQEGSMELTETTEEPVVSKTSRVVEEVVIGKEVEQHEATIRDKVKRTEVDVQRMAAGSQRSPGQYDRDFRSDFETRYVGRGYKYEQYAPAYELGSTYAADQRYNDWSSAESYARRDWESRSQSKWDDVKDAVRYGWEKVRGRR